MPLPERIDELIERFKFNEDSYRSGNYNETQLRREFLDPFFEELGWDVLNRQGYAEAYKDVIHEDAIKIGGVTKAPDYCFRIGGARKFFLEAKKPQVNIKDDISPAFQLRRYAWSAKLPLSVLSDFEEFAVYDCRIEPDKSDKAATARILYCRYTDYADKWEEIAGIFSKQAILKGSFDKYASGKNRKGTQEVDAAFLQEIEAWREALAKNLALRNPELNTRDLNFSVQRTIDRVIFLRICEARGIERYGQLQDLLKSNQVYQDLAVLFQHADDRYNSGLFHFRKEKDRLEPPDDLTLKLSLDDKPLKEIIRKLYYPDSPYEFSVLPADILGQVYEQFLGKVIRLTAGHQAKVEEKPEVRKAGGVYYTPTYIVDYIVKQTVGKLCEGKSPKEVAKLRILDPACGSGSFLLGAYQFLLDWHRDWYSKNEPEKMARGKNPAIVQTANGEWRLTTPERKRILLNNIYGVDIDAQAVETTKLSLLLKVLEGETAETVGQNLRLFQERALPDLGNNIKCGNSLIGPDFYDQGQLAFFDEEERYRINVFDWVTEFPAIMKSGGFDAVIGNPPYGAYLHEASKPYLNSKYSYQTYQLDTYLIFLEKALLDLLAAKGLYGMIIPNPWLTNLLQKSIRRFVVGNVCVIEIVHFQYAVFPKVTVDTEIVILQKNKARNWNAIVRVIESLQSSQLDSESIKTKVLYHEQDKWQKLDGDVINIFTNPTEEKLAAKILSCGIPLENLYLINVGIKPYQSGKGTPPQTKQIVETRPFDSNHQLDKSYRLYLRGRDIGRFKIEPLEIRYLKYGQWLAEPRPAANFDAPIKIVMRQTGDSLVAAMDTNRYLCLNNMHVLVPRDTAASPAYDLGIINSRLLNWYYHTLNPEVGEALAEVKKTNVAKLPIRVINFNDSADRARHDRMVKLVEQMLGLHRQLAAAKTAHEQTMLQRQIAATDSQIDRLVYELYGLTEEEIRIVEEGTAK